MIVNFHYRCTIKYLQFLHNLGVILAVIPPYDYNNVPVEINENYKSYPTFVALLMLTGYVISVIARINNSYPNLSSFTLVVTDASLSFVLTIGNLLSIIAPCLWYSKTVITFLNTFSKIDNFHGLHRKKMEAKQRKNIFVELLIGHSFLIILFVWDAFVWVKKLGIVAFRSYFYRDLQSYYSYIIVMIMYNFTYIIKNRFENLNVALGSDTVVSTINNINLMCSPEFNKMRAINKVRQLSMQYEMLMDQIGMFNQIFGWQILFTTATIVVGLLNTLDILISYGNFGNSHAGVGFGIELIVLSISWSLLQLVSSYSLRIRD